MPRGSTLASLTLTDEQQNQLQGIAQSGYSLQGRRSWTDELTETGGSLFTWPQGSLFCLPFPGQRSPNADRQEPV